MRLLLSAATISDQKTAYSGQDTEYGYSRYFSSSALPASIAATLSSLLWIPQAWCTATIIGSLALEQEIHYTALALLVLCTGLIRTILSACSSRWAFCYARRHLTQKRSAIIESLASVSPVDVNNAPSGFAASVIAEQAEMLTPYFSRFHPVRFRAVIVPVIILLLILPFSWAAVGALLITMPLIPVFLVLIGWKAQKASEEQLVRMGDMNAFLLDRLRGLTTIRALDGVDLTARRLRASADNLRKRTMNVLRIAFMTSAVLEFFSALGVAMVAVYIGFHLLGDLHFGTWGHKLTLTEGFFILLLAPAFFEPLRDLSTVWHDRAAGEAALKALDGLSGKGMSLPGTRLISNSLQNRNPVFDRTPSIHVRNLTFRYGKNMSPVMQNFSCHIEAGEHVAVLGASGMGKTTLLSLICGLAPFESGAILFDGIELDDATAPFFRKHIAWLGQRSHIFAGSLISNISMKRPEIKPDDIRQSLKAASLDTFAEEHNSFMLGEGGNGLSGGEALRLLLARAAVHPDARLILADEPTAHLDTGTAEMISEGLLHVARGKTMIVATHDHALANRMGRIIHLNSLTEFSS